MQELVSPQSRLEASRHASFEKTLVCLAESEREMFDLHEPEKAFPGAVMGFDTTGCTLDEWKDVLFAEQPTSIVTCWATPPLPTEYVEDSLLRLRYVCHLVGSIKTLVPRRLIERGVAVTNWGSLAANAVAEHAVLLILAALRRLPRWRIGLTVPFEQQPQYQMKLFTRSLAGQRVGIHGFGRIARQLVNLLQPFGVTISAYSEGVSEIFIRNHGAEPCSSLEELFSSSTVLVECEALTPFTQDSVTGEILNLLPEDATFVNVGRGKVVDEAALIKMARLGRIRLALDVYYDDPLPLPAAAGLLSLEDVVLSPHIGGPTLDLYRQCTSLAAENLRSFAKGEPLQARISLQEYDRST